MGSDFGDEITRDVGGLPQTLYRFFDFVRRHRKDDQDIVISDSSQRPEVQSDFVDNGKAGATELRYIDFDNRAVTELVKDVAVQDYKVGEVAQKPVVVSAINAEGTPVSRLYFDRDSENAVLSAIDDVKDVFGGVDKDSLDKTIAQVRADLDAWKIENPGTKHVKLDEKIKEVRKIAELAKDKAAKQKAPKQREKGIDPKETPGR